MSWVSLRQDTVDEEDPYSSDLLSSDFSCPVPQNMFAATVRGYLKRNLEGLIIPKAEDMTDLETDSDRRRNIEEARKNPDYHGHQGLDLTTPL